MTKTQISNWLKNLQKNICAQLENADGKAKFSTDEWVRQEGGGGLTRILQNGAVIEKCGVLFSEVHGKTPDFLLRESEHSSAQKNNSEFFAAGVSIVIHPESPMVPVIHMNVRYFEMSGGIKWLGGGIDLTPHYVVEQDAKYFHCELKKVCNAHHPSYYFKFKNWADDYFFLPHRNETRGVGGIFFDRLNEDGEMNFEKNLNFWKDVGELFAPLYCELIQRDKNKAFSQAHKDWQMLRRGRYVEFNLLYDKGTKFGLESNGRTESILMSLPKTAGWAYDQHPQKNSEEEKTISLLKKGINWTE